MKYTILIDSSGVVCIDQVSGKVQKLKDARFEDVTKQCKRYAESKTKRDTMGAYWFNALKGEETSLSRWYEVVETESAKEYFDRLIELQVSQAKELLHTVTNFNNWSEPHCLDYAK